MLLFIYWVLLAEAVRGIISSIKPLTHLDKPHVQTVCDELETEEETIWFNDVKEKSARKSAHTSMVHELLFNPNVSPLWSQDIEHEKT